MGKARRLTAALLLSTALIAPQQARAGFLVGALASFLGGGVATAVSTAIASTVVNVGASLLFSVAANAIQQNRLRKSQVAQQEPGRELLLDTSLPAYRTAYGTCRAPGSYTMRKVKGDIFYGCAILNSRPADLTNRALYIDGRHVQLTGDPFDFQGVGAVPAGGTLLDGLVRVWFGRGDQLSAPGYFVDEVPEFVAATDAWRGRTVIWVRCDAGPSEHRHANWPSFPPVLELDSNWSRVWDPRDPAQHPDDPSTWAFSGNVALLVLDALRNNPVRPYPLASLLLDSFIEAANICDELVALKGGGTELRYQAGGVLAFSEEELEDQLEPLMLAGGFDWTRVGGRLGIVPGAFRPATQVITDMLEGGLEFCDMDVEGEVPTRLLATYTNFLRGSEPAALSPWDIPGAQATDGGVSTTADLRFEMVTSPTQAQRLRNIAGRKARRLRRVSFTAPPSAFDLVAGSVVTLNLPGEYVALNGVYEVERIAPFTAPLGDGEGVALRCPITLREIASGDYAWNPATDEETIDAPAFDAELARVQKPGTITVTSGPGVDINTGTVFIPRFRFAFDPSPSASVIGYRWQYRVQGGEWTAGGWIDGLVRDGSGKVFGFLDVAAVANAYDFRISAESRFGGSGWETFTGAALDMDITVNMASGAPGRFVAEINTPTSSAFAGVVIKRSPAGAGLGAATPITALIPLAPGQTVEVVAGDADGVNLIADKDFEDAGDWSGTDWTTGAGFAQKVPGASLRYLRNFTPFEAGATYRYTITMFDRVAGWADLRLEGATVPNTDDFTTNGVWYGGILAPASPASIVLAGSADGDFKLGDFWLVKSTPECLSQGLWDFYIIPVAQTGTEGTAAGPMQRFIY